MDRVIVVRPGGGEAISSGTSVRHVKVDIESLHVTEYTVEAAPMGDLHIHQRHADAFYVLEGELEVALSETETVLVGPGGFAVAPPGAVHAFGVPVRARFLNIHAPGVSFAAYLREIVSLSERGEKPGRELFERFDMHLRQDLPKDVKPRFFRTRSEFSSWLERNHDRAKEVWVGYYKKSTGRPSITWSESTDEAIRFGWIDSVPRGIDHDRYMNRFTPRRAGSSWSAKNIQRAQELIQQGKMHPSGLKAFDARGEPVEYSAKPPRKVRWIHPLVV